VRTIPLPSQAELRRLFDYDPETGDLIWPANNRKSNLRKADHVQNMGNLGRSPQRDLPRGVTLRCDGKKWVAKIRFDNAEMCLGSYDTPELAAAAYADAATKFRGDFARVANV